MTTMTTIEAKSQAALVNLIMGMERGTRVRIVATENGAPWAWVEVSPLTDSTRSVFPLIPGGSWGDTRKRSEAGVIASHLSEQDARHAVSVAVARAARMFRKYGNE